MGLDIYQKIVIGIPVNEDDLFFEEVVQRDSCDHNERIGNKFCPVCGTKVFSCLVEKGEILVENCELYKVNYNSKTGIFGMKLELDVVEGNLVVDFLNLNYGAIIRVDNDVSEKIEYLKEKLQEAGLDTKKLGVYVISEVSY